MIPDFLREAFAQADHNAADFVRHQVKRERAQKPAPAPTPSPPSPDLATKDFVFGICRMIGGEVGATERRINERLAALEAQVSRDPLSELLEELPELPELPDTRVLPDNVVELPGN